MATCPDVLHARLAAGSILAGLLATTLLLLAASAPLASAGDRDCLDFDTQKQAQRFFKKHHPKKDPHGLDADNDGIACENNPCPCSTKSAFNASGVWVDRQGRAYTVTSPGSGY